MATKRSAPVDVEDTIRENEPNKVNKIVDINKIREYINEEDRRGLILTNSAAMTTWQKGKIYLEVEVVCVSLGLKFLIADTRINKIITGPTERIVFGKIENPDTKDLTIRSQFLYTFTEHKNVVNAVIGRALASLTVSYKPLKGIPTQAYYMKHKSQMIFIYAFLVEKHEPSERTFIYNYTIEVNNDAERPPSIEEMRAQHKPLAVKKFVSFVLGDFTILVESIPTIPTNIIPLYF
jgi:hypothetical protein